MKLASQSTISFVWRDEGSDRDARRIGEKLGYLQQANFRVCLNKIDGSLSYLADSANVLVPRCLIEAQILVQPEAHIVTVQPVGEFVEMEKMLF